MANITISRQDYRDAAQVSASAPAQYAGWEPNTISGALSATAGTAWEIPAPTGALSASGRNDTFKDHKTVFLVNNGQSAAVNITLKGGDTYAGNKDVVLSAPVGISMFWIDSSKFANKTTGKIEITAASAVQIIGYEMR
jgi:hypothetical protein